MLQGGGRKIQCVEGAHELGEQFREPPRGSCPEGLPAGSAAHRPKAPPHRSCRHVPGLQSLPCCTDDSEGSLPKVQPLCQGTGSLCTWMPVTLPLTVTLLLLCSLLSSQTVAVQLCIVERHEIKYPAASACTQPHTHTSSRQLTRMGLGVHHAISGLTCHDHRRCGCER